MSAAEAVGWMVMVCLVRTEDVTSCFPTDRVWPTWRRCHEAQVNPPPAEGEWRICVPRRRDALDTK